MKYLNIEDRYIGLSILRVIVSILLIKTISLAFPVLEVLYIDMVPENLGYLDGKLSFLGLENLLHFFNDIHFLYLFFTLFYLLAFLFLFGIGGTVVGFILYIFILIFHSLNPYVLDGSDNVMLVIFPFLILSNSYKYLGHKSLYPSLELRIRKHKFIDQFARLFTIALLIQVCYVYFFTAAAKATGELWHKGTAVYYTMRVNEFMATDWNIILTENLYFVVLATYGTLLVEIAMSFLIWFKSTRFYIILALIGLHTGIWVFMRIDNFSSIMIATYFVFITDFEYKQIVKIAKKIIPKNLSNYAKKYSFSH